MIFGDSHTVALAQALAFRESKSQTTSPAIELFRLRKLKGDIALGDTSIDEFCEKISGLGPDDLVFSAIGGNQYAIASTVRVPPFFELAVKDDHASSRDEQAILIPVRVFESYITSGVINSDGPMLKRIRSATCARVFHLTPPPPKHDNAFLKQFHEARFAAEGLGDPEPHAPELRLACWDMQCGALQMLCTQIGVELLPPPPAAVGSDRFLEERYYSKDVTHANRRYGEQVLRQIESVCEDFPGRSQ